MAVCIRLSRYGRLHRPFFRIVAIDRRCHREGLANEVLGTYDPLQADGKAIAVKADRVEAWLARGALISDGLDKLFRHHGVAINRPAPAKARRQVRAASAAPKPTPAKTWVAPSRRSLRKHAAKLKAERKAAAAAAAPAAPAESPKA